MTTITDTNISRLVAPSHRHAPLHTWETAMTAYFRGECTHCWRVLLLLSGFRVGGGSVNRRGPKERACVTHTFTSDAYNMRWDGKYLSLPSRILSGGRVGEWGADSSARLRCVHDTLSSFHPINWIQLEWGNTQMLGRFQTLLDIAENVQKKTALPGNS